MQNKLIISSMMKYSLQNRVFLYVENRQNDSQITKCFGFDLQNIILAAGDTTTEIVLHIILFCITFVIHNLLIQPDCVCGDSKCSKNLTRQATDASDRSPNKCSNTNECWSIVLNRTLEIPRSFDQRKHPRESFQPPDIFANLSPTTAIFMFVYGTL